MLLDTCAPIWLGFGDPPQSEGRELAERAASSGTLLVSPISSWEVGILVRRSRLVLHMSPSAWWRATIEQTGAVLAALTPEVLLTSSFLPGSPPNDPADRIIAATAREYGLTLMTRDAKLLAYAEAGHLAAAAC